MKRDSSIKNAEWDRAERLRKRSWIQKHQDRQKTFQWRKFLSNSKNKLLLIPLRIVRRNTEKLAGNKIFVTAEDRCYEVSSIGTTTRKLRSTQEKADTRVLLRELFFWIKPRFDKRVSFRRTSLVSTNESRFDERVSFRRTSLYSRTNESLFSNKRVSLKIVYRVTHKSWRLKTSCFPEPVSDPEPLDKRFPTRLVCQNETCWITHGFWETTRFLIVRIHESLDKRFSTRLVCSRIETRLVCRNEVKRQASTWRQKGVQPETRGHEQVLAEFRSIDSLRKCFIWAPKRICCTLIFKQVELQEMKKTWNCWCRCLTEAGSILLRANSKT